MTYAQGRLFHRRGKLESLHSEFLRITLDRYNAMVRRVAPQIVPFDADGYRGWFVLQLGGTEHGHARCAYCNHPVDLHTAQTEHREPIAQGGSLHLDNLTLACVDCNQIKGPMTYAGFIELQKQLRTNPLFSLIDADSVRGRLKIAMRLTYKNHSLMRENRLLAEQLESAAIGVPTQSTPPSKAIRHVRMPRGG